MKIKIWSTEIGFQLFNPFSWMTGLFSIPDNAFDYYEMFHRQYDICRINKNVVWIGIPTTYEISQSCQMHERYTLCWHFLIETKENKILNNRKVVTQWDLSKSSAFICVSRCVLCSVICRSPIFEFGPIHQSKSTLLTISKKSDFLEMVKCVNFDCCVGPNSKIGIRQTMLENPVEITEYPLKPILT